MAEAAWAASDVHAVAAYAAILDPALWLERADGDPDAACDLAAARAAGEAGLADALGRFLKRLRAEALALQDAFGREGAHPGRRDRLMLLHGLRVALLQRLGVLAAEIPAFSARGETSRAVLQERLMRLDVPAALSALSEIFPCEAPPAPQDADFGEPATYSPEETRAWRDVHEALFGPMARLHDLALRISAAVTHEIGAMG
jgi:phosphoenolpyruvate carboxylase